MAQGSGTKRKRADESSSSKKKKVVSVAEPTAPATIRVSKVIKPQFSPPVIATTPGLCVSASVQFESYTQAPKINPRKKQNATPVGDLLLHSSSHRMLDYTGREEGFKGAEAPLRHYIGIFDPLTGQLQVVEARKMIVRGAVRSQQAPADAMAEHSGKQSNMELKNDLGQTFGTKKAKKAILALTENAIAPKRVPGETDTPKKLNSAELALIDSLKQTTSQMASKEELQAAVDRAKPVPKGHYDAEEIQDVYVAEEIIGAEVLNSIPVRDWQQTLKEGEAIQLHSRFVAHRVSRVAAHENALQRLRVLRYLYWLIKFWLAAKSGKQRGIKRVPPRAQLKEALDGAPDVVADNLRHKFSENGDMRKYHIDLLMTHCCVFASIIDSFEVITTDLREDLKLEQKQLNQYFMEVGARLKQVKLAGRTDTVAKLTLPLVFPKIPTRRG